MIVWKLNMPLRQKVGICILLTMHLFTMGCSIAKAVAAESGTTSTEDKLYKTSLGLLWALAEQSFVIMMGCAPPLSSITKLPVMLSISASMKKLVSSRTQDGSFHRQFRPDGRALKFRQAGEFCPDCRWALTSDDLALCLREEISDRTCSQLLNSHTGYQRLP